MTEEENRMVRELHDYFMVPEIEGKPSRAKQIDDVLMAARAGKMGARAVLWLCGFIISISATWSAIKGWHQ